MALHRSLKYFLDWHRHAFTVPRSSLNSLLGLRRGLHAQKMCCLSHRVAAILAFWVLNLLRRNVVNQILAAVGQRCLQSNTCRSLVVFPSYGMRWQRVAVVWNISFAPTWRRVFKYLVFQILLRFVLFYGSTLRCCCGFFYIWCRFFHFCLHRVVVTRSQLSTWCHCRTAGRRF